MIYIVVGSHNITLLDGLPTEIIKKKFAIIMFSIKKIPGCMTYVVNPELTNNGETTYL